MSFTNDDFRDFVKIVSGPFYRHADRGETGMVVVPFLDGGLGVLFDSANIVGFNSSERGGCWLVVRGDDVRISRRAVVAVGKRALKVSIGDPDLVKVVQGELGEYLSDFEIGDCDE